MTTIDPISGTIAVPQEPVAPPQVAEPVAGGDSPAAPAADDGAPDFSVIEKITGGQVKSLEDWETFQSAKSEVEAFKARVSALEAEKQQISPLALKINELAAKGIEEVAKFVELQRLDVDSMSPLDALRTKTRLDHPELSPEEVDGLLQEKGYINPLDDLTPGQAAKVKVDAKDAKTYLNSLKVDLAQLRQPMVAAEDPNVVAQRAATHAAWDTLAAASAGSDAVQVKIGDVTEQLTVSKEAMAAGVTTAQQWAKANGLDVNDQNKTLFTQLAHQVAIAQDFHNILARDRQRVVAETEARVRQELSGAPPPPVSANEPPAAKTRTPNVYVE